MGVLALQGDFLEHKVALHKIGVEAVEVRLPQQLDDLNGVIIPGGESTTIARLMDIFHFREPLKQKIASGLAVWGTCAGMILLAERLREPDPIPLGVMDIVVSRNAYGRQIDSFEADLHIPALGEEPFHAVFIRAPKVVSVGRKAQVLASTFAGDAIAIAQDKLLATSFHPEITEDIRFHSMFFEMATSKV